MGIEYSELGLEENVARSLIESGYISRRLEVQALQDFKNHAIDVEMLFSFWEIRSQAGRTIIKDAC